MTEPDIRFRNKIRRRYGKLNPYERYLLAANLARVRRTHTQEEEEAAKQLERELRFSRLKARAYLMYAIKTPYF